MSRVTPRPRRRARLPATPASRRARSRCDLAPRQATTAQLRIASGDMTTGRARPQDDVGRRAARAARGRRRRRRAASAPCWAPRCARPGTPWSASPRCRGPAVERAEVLLPGVPVLEVPEVVERAELVLLTVPDDALPELVAGPGRDRRLAAGPARRAHLRPVRLAGARAGGAARRDPARAAPGDDVHRHQPRPGPARRLLLRRHARPGRCCRSRRRSSSRWAPSRWWSPRRPGRSTTRRSRTARTTWSRWSRRRSTCCAPAGVEQPDRVLGPLLSAALDNALRSGRRRAHRPGRPRRRRHGRRAPGRDRAPATRTVAGRPTAALARATADRALAAGRLRADAAAALLAVLAVP